MDSLAAHKVAGIRAAIEARGASLLCLPACSADLNPIELLFSKMKRLSRSAAARTLAAPWNALGACLDRFSTAECRACIRHAGCRHPG